MADKRISQLVERTDIANNDVVPIVAFGASTTNKATISSIQSYMQENLDVGVTSIGLSMPSAFVVSNSPVTMSGNISVTGAGTVSQYIRGDGSLADFPQGGGGGGASVNYYLNGSVSQGTIGGIAFREMSKSPILGTGTDFVAIADGYLASFITDAGDPALLEIPGGNWNFETYFSASSGGGTPSFYVELYKVNSGGTATLIASNSGTPELIAFGTTITPYFSTLAVPTTTLTLTDRLALRYYVARSGRTITLHTENSHLCQIITTFTTGLTALNGLTAQVQNFTTGTSGTNFAISSTGNTHTFNLPDASATARGVVTTGIQTIAGIKNFTSTIRSAVSVEMAATGTALPTELKNINGPGLSSSGSNGIGFNSSNNLYFSGSDKGCAVISMTNTGTRTYTLQDTSGVIALTSNIPTNPLGGSGSINQIPKYTSSTTTLGNSNISDNGTDVGIASRTAISLGGQSIIFTPNLGGTTNRIETTGSLPLALVTGGALTLAAGGTTPQITLATTGAVTLTGALNGTSGSFTGDVNAGTGFQGRYTRIFEASAQRGGLYPYNVISGAGTDYSIGLFSESSLWFAAGGGITKHLTIASTGAASFSSSVRASSLNVNVDSFGTDVSINSSVRIGSAFSNAASIVFGDAGTPYWSIGRPAGSGNFVIGSFAASNALSLATSGAATFSSTIGVGGSGATYSTLESSSATFGSTIPLMSLAIKDGTYNPRTTISYRTQTGSAYSVVFDSGYSSGWAQTNYVFASGNVGVGTSSPATKLDVASGTSGSGEVQRWSYNDGNPNFSLRLRQDVSSGLVKHVYDVVNNGTTFANTLVLDRGSVFIGNNAATYSEKALIQYAGTGNQGLHISQTGSSAANDKILFSNSNGIVGYIRTDGSTTSYVSASDYRLKENIHPVKNALSKLAQLKPCNYNFITDPEKEIMGFLAHEVQEVIPQAVHGEKDEFIIKELEVSPPELDEEGNIITEAVIEEKEIPVYQGIDHSKLVPLLVAAIQEQQEQINQLKNQIK